MLQLVDGNEEAAARLWERYHQRILELARAKLRGQPRRVADEEDVALEAFDSFYRRAQQGGLSRCKDRGDLWRLLVAITVRKVVDHFKHEQRKKRGGGRVFGESDFPLLEPGEEVRLSNMVTSEEPSPELAAQLVDQYNRLMALLPDDQSRLIARLKLEGYTEAEIAAKIQRVTRTVRRRIEVIRRIWREELDSG